MSIDELNLKDEIKCTCILCNGTGINKNSYQSEFGFICNGCNGLGYMILKKSDGSKIVKDEVRDDVYYLRGDNLDYQIDLFSHLQSRDDVNYVMFDFPLKLKSRIALRHALKNHFIISYQDFLNGDLPLPNPNNICPENLLRMYSEEKFKDDCVLYGSYNVCNKSHSGDCWKIFYDESQTYEEKQNVLKRILH